MPLASNQVQYSLLYREPERNGVKKAIEDVGATLVAYSPLNQGLLTGWLRNDWTTKQDLPLGICAFSAVTSSPRGFHRLV